MTITKTEAIRIRKLIEHAMKLIDDRTASEAVTLLPHMKYDGALISAGTPIEWNGTVKRASVDLWDTEENNPDNAPALWADIDYIDGVRKIPVTDSGIFDATLAFAENEEGYFTVDDTIYISKVNGNVYTPERYPNNWKKKEG